MTSSSGTGRSATDQNTRDERPPRPDQAKDSSPPTSNGKGAGQAGSDASAVKHGQKPTASPAAPSGNGRPPVPPGSSVNTAGPGAVPAKAPNPSSDDRRRPAKPNGPVQPQGQPSKGGAVGDPKAQRTRKDTTPRDKQNSTVNPWARPQAPAGPAPASSPTDGRRAGPVVPPSASPVIAADVAAALAGSAGSAASPVAPAANPASGEPKPPVPPPSLVAKQRRDAMAAQRVADAAPAVAPVPSVDTEASMDAIPPAERPAPKLARTAAPRRGGRIRKARLRLLGVDPWSVMKTAFLLSVALGIALFVAVAVLWSVLDAAGVFESVDGIISDMTTSETNAGIDINQYVELSRVLGFTTLIAVADVVLLTALATLGAFLYNLSASLLGGIELTLAEDD